MSRIDRKYVERLRELQKAEDPEDEHDKADQILCELLIELSYQEVVKEWAKVKKWYSFNFWRNYGYYDL